MKTERQSLTCFPHDACQFLKLLELGQLRPQPADYISRRMRAQNVFHDK
jgi:hypothetical protein